MERFTELNARFSHFLLPFLEPRTLLPPERGTWTREDSNLHFGEGSILVASLLHFTKPSFFVHNSQNAWETHEEPFKFHYVP